MKLVKNTIGDLFLKQTDELRNKNAIGWFENDELKFYSYKEYKNIVESFSLALIKKGIIKQDKVCILSQTRKEWNILDLSILCAGAITTPIYHTYLSHEIEFIVNHSEAKMIIVEDDDQFNKLFKVLEKLKSLKFIVSIEKLKDENKNKIPSSIQYYTYNDLMGLGSEEMQQNPDTFKRSIEETYPDDIASIIYTSGTTGDPKGAVITHGAFTQMLINVKLFTHNAFNKDDRNLIFLPLSHVLGRADSLLLLVFGHESIYAESIDSLLDNIQVAKPTYMISVPRIFEKIYAKVTEDIANSSSIKQSVFEWASQASSKYFETLAQDKTPSTFDILQHQLAYKLVFSKVYVKFGGRIRFFISGGAPLSVDIIEFLRNANLTILEGYGLTETVAPCCLNPLSKQIPGTVGQPMGDVEFKFADDNEILIKSKALFKEYYKNEQATSEVIDENGWFHTGDIGHFTPEGFLKITDRKKDIIITSGGKNVAPQKIENMLKLHPGIAQCVIAGDKRKYLTAIISLDKDSYGPDFLKNAELNSDSTFEDFAVNQSIYNDIQSKVALTNEKLAQFETIKKFIIVGEEFTTDNYLTPSLKVKKKLVLEKYAEQIDTLYQD